MCNERPTVKACPKDDYHSLCFHSTNGFSLPINDSLFISFVFVLAKLEKKKIELECCCYLKDFKLFAPKPVTFCSMWKCIEKYEREKKRVRLPVANFEWYAYSVNIQSGKSNGQCVQCTTSMNVISIKWWFCELGRPFVRTKRNHSYDHYSEVIIGWNESSKINVLNVKWVAYVKNVKCKMKNMQQSDKHRVYSTENGLAFKFNKLKMNNQTIGPYTFNVHILYY